MDTIWRWCVLGFMFTTLASCGTAGPSASSNELSADAANLAQPAAAPRDAAILAAPAEADAGGIARKIVYRANIELVCERITAIAERLESLATAAGGFVADAQLVGSSGEPRWGTWKLRVPVGRFDGLLTEIKKLAEVRGVQTTSDDVSEEYYDIEARLHNKRQEETRLLRLLDDRTAELEHVLAVEREISRVREETERLQARQRVLANLTELATITVRVHEAIAHPPEMAAAFGVRLKRGVQQSLTSLVGALQAFVIGVAVSLPWLVVFSLPLIAAAILARRCRVFWSKPRES